MLNIDTGREAKEAKGMEPPKLKQYIQLAGRNLYRLAANGAGPAKDKWEGHAFEEGDFATFGDGGLVVLQVNYDGKDFHVVDTTIIPRNSKLEKDRGIIKLLLQHSAEAQAAAAKQA